jgi:transposase InsO family protein
MKTIDSCLKFETSDVAKFRLHVLEYYYKWGLQPTVDAFGVKTSTLYGWKREFEKAKGKLISLVPKSTQPKTTRRMTTDWRLVEFIKQMRQEHGNLGKAKIKPFLDEYARELGIPTIGLTTIGKLIKRRHLTFESRIKQKRKTRYHKLRTRKSPKVRKPGYVQMDSITVFINGEKFLFMSVIDILTKLALVKRVDCLSSAHAKAVFQEFENQLPYLIKKVQTDNGSEFLAKFHEYLEEQKIPHIFIYPKSPKINGVVERFNRTIQEEFINRSDEIYYDLDAFEVKLTTYLNWYNHKRPHHSLKYLSPADYVTNLIPKCG